MKWTFDLPYRDPDDSVVSIADAASEILDGEECTVATQLAFDALGRGTTKVGDLLEELDSAGPDGRRRFLDAARERAGLPSTSKVEATEAFEAANRSISSSSPPRDSSGRIEARCSAPTCLRYAPDPSYPGIAMKVHQRRWFCSEHQGLAEPGDDQPWRGARLGFNRIGLVVDLDEQDRDRERAETEAESRRRRHEQKEAERRREAERFRKSQALRDARFRSEMPKGLRP
jgi:hypothetical protein